MDYCENLKPINFLIEAIEKHKNNDNRGRDNSASFQKGNMLGAKLLTELFSSGFSRHSEHQFESAWPGKFKNITSYVPFKANDLFLNCRMYTKIKILLKTA